MQLICNVMLVSGIQQSNSATSIYQYSYLFILFQIHFQRLQEADEVSRTAHPKWHNPNPSPTWKDSRVKRRKDRFGSQIWNLSTCWLYDFGTKLSVLIQGWACVSVILRDKNCLQSKGLGFHGEQTQRPCSPGAYRLVVAVWRRTRINQMNRQVNGKLELC